MLFNWDTTNLCIIFRSWQIRGTPSLLFSLLAIVTLVAGYEALRSATQRFELATLKHTEALSSESSILHPISPPNPRLAHPRPLSPPAFSPSQSCDISQSTWTAQRDEMRARS
jgi:hypothetical protein